MEQQPGEGHDKIGDAIKKLDMNVEAASIHTPIVNPLEPNTLPERAAGHASESEKMRKRIAEEEKGSGFDAIFDEQSQKMRKGERGGAVEGDFSAL